MVAFGRSRIEEQLVRDKEHVRQYCKQEGIILTDIKPTFERGFFEPMYFFSDNLGGYTIDGIVECLERVV